MSGQPETMTCELCEKIYHADAVTMTLRDTRDWRGDCCPECRLSHFVCADCDSITHVDDRDHHHPACCRVCVDLRVENAAVEALETARGELQELVDGLIGSSDLSAIQAALDALRTVTPSQSAG